ncbi:Acetolactate synthase large subunit IlvG [Afipia felis]|uniref:Acetolactate synthase large subunit IlvG n=1 Tax=Afipia felis TaxID=1035 RepID=A0A090MI55_AFIFE|nr:thiamine pyrophosphate protein TPP binding domain protein [Afipia sp. 1NLS2]CEG07211.1 Acetolactate synthase large subunit IlvG [Afipia felis]
MRGADLLAQTLKAAGTSRIFSLSGNQIMPVYDACFELGIEIVHTRHEAAAVFMAEAHAQLTGEVGVALVTAGGGLGNAVGPLFSVGESETPVLLLSGDSPVAQDGRGAFQEMSQCAVTAPLTKLSVRPTKASDLGHETARAIRTARSGRPGPVHVALAFDVLEADAGATAAPSAFERVPQWLGNEDTKRIAQAIATAQRPVLVCGPALNRTRNGNLTERLAAALDVPVIVMESPRGLRDPSLGEIGKVLAQADLIVSLGKRVDFTLAFGGANSFDANAGWIVVDAENSEFDRAHLNLGSRLKMTAAATAVDAAMQLIELGKASHAQDHAKWRSQAAERLATRNSVAGAGGETITSAQLCEAVQRQIKLASNSVAVCDGGEIGQWAQALTAADHRIINGVSGVIGGGLCYGLAAALAKPGHKVFAMMGDGTVGFHFAEVETAARHGASYVIVIGNDMRWNAEHQIQLREYGPNRLIGCQLSGARYDLATEAMGGHGEYVTRLDELDAALSRAVASGKVACVNVMIDGAPAPAGH